MKSAKAIIKSVTMFASWFASIDISENRDITFIELQQFLTRSIVGKKGFQKFDTVRSEQHNFENTSFIQKIQKMMIYRRRKNAN